MPPRKPAAAPGPLPPFPITPPVEPMLASAAGELPEAGAVLYEPKWDGFRAIIFRGAGPGDLYMQSRESRPLDRYFPELRAALDAQLPPACVLDGEIVIATRAGLDFDALQMRLHPAASRVRKLAAEVPSSFVAFDLLAEGGADIREQPQRERRARLERLLAGARPPLHLTPATPDRDVAARWLEEFEGAGLDGVVAKPSAGAYQPGKRVMIKVKHARTCDCVVAGFRWHKAGEGIVGSLLLGLHDAKGDLQHVGVTSAFTMAVRKALAKELEPLRANAMEGHPWRAWAGAAEAHAAREAGEGGEGAGDGGPQRMPGAQSRWSAGKDLSWEPLRIERVCEVRYEKLQGDRFRHAAIFLRWRPDRDPRSCRYDQLEVTPPYELSRVFSSGSSGP